MTSKNDKQPEGADPTRTQGFDREIRNILMRIEQEPIPQNLTRLAEELQAALKKMREAGK